MSGGFIVSGKSTSSVEDLTIRTFADAGVHRFASKAKRTRATELVVHESVTRSVDSTVSVLKKRGLGVHLILGPDGMFTQHGDLATDVLWHASGHNGVSFGVEVVNPYYPRHLKQGLPWGRVIDAPWAHEKKYVLPTPAQAEAVAALVGWTTSAPAAGIQVPRRWVGLRNGYFALGLVTGAEKPTPGIFAHQYFGHADGSFLVLYAWLRLEAGLAPNIAFEEAVKRTTGVRRADVRALIPTTAVA
jgi:hypothetical protein